MHNFESPIDLSQNKMLFLEQLVDQVINTEGQLLLSLSYITDTLGLTLPKMEQIFKNLVLVYARRRPIEITSDFFSGPDIQMPQGTLGIKSIRWGILPEYPRYFQPAWDELSYEYNMQTKILKVFPPNTQIKVTYLAYPTLTKSQKVKEVFDLVPGETIYEDMLQSTPRQGTLNINFNNYSISEIARDSFAFTGSISNTTFTGDIITTTITGNIANGSNIIYNIPSTAGLVVDTIISGLGIPVGTTITSIDSLTQIHISNNYSIDNISSDQEVCGCTEECGHRSTCSHSGICHCQCQNYSNSLNNNETFMYGSGIFTGDIEEGSNIIYGIPSTSSLSIGMIISGLGIPVGTTITSIDSLTQIHISNNALIKGRCRYEDIYKVNGVSENNVTFMYNPGSFIGSIQEGSNIITNITSTSGLIAGMSITGLGIPVGTTITSIDSSTQIHVSNIAFPLQPNISFTIPTNTITNIPSTANLVAGMSITGLGIPVGTTITSIDDLHTIHISNSVSTSESSVTFSIANNTIYNIPSAANLIVGMSITGLGIPIGTTITSIDSSSQIHISNNVTTSATNAVFTIPLPNTVLLGSPSFTGNSTNGSNIITNIPSTANLSVGKIISGTGIPVGTTITSIDSTTQIHISNNATVSSVSVTLLIGGNLGTGTYDLTTRQFTITLNSNVNGGQLIFTYYPKYYCCVELDMGDYIYYKLFALNILRSVAAMKSQLSQDNLQNIDLDNDNLMERVRNLEVEVRDLLRKTISFGGLGQI